VTAVVTIVVPILVIALVVIVVILFSICVWTIKKRKENTISLYISHHNEGTPAHNNNNIYTPDPTVTDSDKLPNIPRENITYLGDLGQGNYGKVIKGEARNIHPGQSSTLVATKILKVGSSSAATSNFMKEALIMNQFDHPNILKLLGVCFDKEPLYIIFEYMNLGDLNNYLRSTSVSASPPSSNLTIQQLVNMAVNIAAGLEYLAVRHFVHRDLATRNCLINEQLFVKIADFGLSKDVYSRDYYRLGDKSVLPIRWMPPEAILYCKFSTQSDIWSFGIVLWEIFAGGAQPYYTLSNKEIVDYVIHKKNRLQCPSGCPTELYNLMVSCWISNPKKRPTASQVHSCLQNWTPCMDNSATHPKSLSMANPLSDVDYNVSSPNQILETAV